MTPAPAFNQQVFDDLLLERRLIEALKILLDNADWDLPSYNHEKCCLFIANTRRFLAMQPSEIMTGGRETGHMEKYNMEVLHQLLEQALRDKDKNGPVESFAGISFGVEQNARGYF